MRYKNFKFDSPRQLIFGSGQIKCLPDLAKSFGSRVLIVTGKSALLNSPAWEGMKLSFSKKGCTLFQASISKEPSPAVINGITGQFRAENPELVIAVGGGSVMDAGKAISAMLTCNDPVEDFLEGVGTKAPSGKRLPFIAVPTTSGTGSEATKNAVISQPGADGFKKSLRHDNLVPDIALVDPDLTLTCPSAITAACGMDALTQLLEAYVSTHASPMTDAVCQSGLKGFGQALETAVLKAPEDMEARSILSFGAYSSGIALANAGLGTVHGFASVVGGLSPMSHGNVCGTLLADTIKESIENLAQETQSHPALEKYATAAGLLGISPKDAKTKAACTALVDQLYAWTRDFNLPRLGESGVPRQMLAKIAKTSGNKNNPAPLDEPTRLKILKSRF